jgi:hypothetical protein
MISRAREAGHIKGVMDHLIPGGITHLQYADDTMILLDPSDEGILNLKLIKLCFEDMSGLKINLSKSELVVVGKPAAEKVSIGRLLNCKLVDFPITYMGLPVSNKRLRVSDWKFLSGKVGHRVDPWQGMFLASAGRLELSNSCLSSLPMFAMSLYMLYDATDTSQTYL